RAHRAHQRGARERARAGAHPRQRRLPLAQSRHGRAAGGVRAVPRRLVRDARGGAGRAAVGGRRGDGASLCALRAGARGDRVSRPQPERHAPDGAHPALPAARRARSERGQHPARNSDRGAEPPPPRGGGATMSAAVPRYLDYAATTPVDPAVAAAMSGCLTAGGDFANPSSTHAPGMRAAARIEAARAQVAALIGAALGALCRERGIAFHSDCAQAAGKVPLDVHALPVDFVSVTAHKLYGPKGVGALYVRRGAKGLLQPLLYGGGQERSLRPGTLATHQIVGFGVACEIAARELPREAPRLTALRERLWQSLSQLGGVHLNGAGAPRVP